MKKIIVLFLFTITLAAVTNAQWVEKNNGLYGGSVTTFTVSGTNIYAGTRNGGIFKSANNPGRINWIVIKYILRKT